jgi:hypothetical protein
MSNLLDDMLSSIIVSENGELLARKQILEFDGTFDLVELEDRIVIHGGGSSAPLDGDVTGAVNASRVEEISGDVVGDLDIHATRFLFDEQFEFIHATKRIFAGNASGSVVGHPGSLNVIDGGVQFIVRNVSANVTLDTTTKDMLVRVDASAGPVIVTLPPEATGRTLIFFTKGANTVSIRSGGVIESRIINGSASDYVVPFNNACVVVTMGAGGWLARSFSDAGVALPPLGGDVTGPGGANWITTISGDGGDPVTIAAETLLFANGTAGPLGRTTIYFSEDPDGGTDGAIEIKHGAKRVFFGHATYPEFGNQDSSSFLRGGLVLQPRSVISNVTLDTGGTKDTLAFVEGGGGALQVTLPPANQGRMVIVPFTPAIPSGSHVIKRSGLEQINGVGADYTIPGSNTAGGFTFCFSDGFGWFARTLKDAVAPASLLGDVIGTTTTNRVTTISGVSGTGLVAIPATELRFDSGASFVSQIAIGFAGALLLTHDAITVFDGHKDTPKVGAVTSIVSMQGGLKLSTKTTAVDVTLDVSTKESMVHVDASAAARNITLPAAAVGRTFIFMIRGSNTVVIKRAGADTINNVAGDYTVPLPNSCVIASSYTGGWYIRSFADSMGVTMGPGPGSATGSASKTFGFAYGANANANFDLTTATYAGLKTSIDAGKVVMVKAMTQCWYNWASALVTILSTATSASNPTQQGAPLFDGSESPERVPPGSTFLNILGGPVAGTLTVYLAE